MIVFFMCLKFFVKIKLKRYIFSYKTPFTAFIYIVIIVLYSKLLYFTNYDASSLFVEVYKKAYNNFK